MSKANNVNTTNQIAQFLAPEAHQRPVFHAQPYSLDATGFYFTDMDDYQAKYEANRDRFGFSVEEYEIQFIDGDAEDAQLYEAAGINQTNIEFFIEEIMDLDDYQKPGLYFLLDMGYDVDDAIAKIDDVMLQEGNLEEAAEALFDEIYLDQIPENLRSYIDYKSFARDCEYSGDFREFDFSGTTYTCTNASSI
jgi:hypothetical protein